jgi:hypothetical protein
MADSGGLVVQVCPGPEDDAGELAQLAGLLRGELLDLDVSAVDRLPDEAVPPGATGVAAVAGWLAVQLGPEALRTVCVPKTSSTLCDQAIFVDQAADASLFPDAVLVEIDRFG